MRNLILLALLLVTITACAPTQQTTSDAMVGQDNMMEKTNTPGDTMMGDEMVGTDSGVKEFDLEGYNYRFEMDGVEAPELGVKQGDRVRIVLTSADGFHDWVIDEFNAATDRVSTGQTASVEFVADKKGTFEYYCSVGNHRANGMYGTFVVE